MNEEHLEPLKEEGNLGNGKGRKNNQLLSKEEKIRKFRSSSFSDSLDQSDNQLSYGDGENSFLSNPLPSVSVTRLVSIPDRVRVVRSLRLPEMGPKILFFSGGTAIRDLSSCLKDYTHNSIHLITPFDSGGSSAEIRRAFDMLSVGDLRNRLLALAAKNEATASNNPQIVELFSHRLNNEDQDAATEEFLSILLGRHPLTRAVRMPMRSILQNHLKWFANRMPVDFDLRGASIGNLIITGCFLEHDRDIVSVIFMISKFLGVKGFCRPLTAANLHIRTLYSDGTEEVGQHMMNVNKGASSQLSPSRKIVQMDLVEGLHSVERQESQTCHIDIVSSDLVASADLIVFPMGSFFASILVNLLPKGVGRAIVRRKCPKVYVPNTGHDPEMTGYTLAECVERIIAMVRDDHKRHSSRDLLQSADVPVRDILNFVVIDTTYCRYSVEIDKEAIANIGVAVVDVPLLSPDQCSAIQSVSQSGVIEKSTRLDPSKIAEVLISLAS
jgi:CofD-related protein of GAK system